jgi:hypothetical protein
VAHGILGGRIRHILVDCETGHSSPVFLVASLLARQFRNGSFCAQEELTSPCLHFRLHHEQLEEPANCIPKHCCPPQATSSVRTQSSTCTDAAMAVHARLNQTNKPSVTKQYQTADDQLLLLPTPPPPPIWRNWNHHALPTTDLRRWLGASRCRC